MAVCNHFILPNVSKTLVVEVDLLRVNANNPKPFQSQLILSAMVILMDTDITKDEITYDNVNNLWVLLNPQYGDPSVNGLPRCRTMEEEFKQMVFWHGLIVNIPVTLTLLTTTALQLLQPKANLNSRPGIISAVLLWTCSNIQAQTLSTAGPCTFAINQYL